MVFKRHFIFFSLLFQYYYLYTSSNQSDKKENHFPKYAEKAKKNLESLKSSFIDQNELSLLFFSGLGCYYLNKKYGQSFFKSISCPIGTWTALHSIFLIIINKNANNIKNILIPFRAEKLKNEDHILSHTLEVELYFFPILSFLKKKYFPSSERTSELREKIIILCKNNFTPISFFCFGIFFRFLKQSPIKKLIYYAIIQELLLTMIFLSEKKNRTLEKCKHFLLDHINPTSEIRLQLKDPEVEKNIKSEDSLIKYTVELEKNIKISPFLSFIYEILLQIKLMPDVIGKYNIEHIITEFDQWLTEYGQGENLVELKAAALNTFKAADIKNRTTLLNIKNILETTTL